MSAASPAPAPAETWFVATGLEAGGAERALSLLLPRLRARGVASRVWSLSGPGRFGRELTEAGIPVEDLGVRGIAGAIAAARRFRLRLRAERPSLVQGWMYHGNLLACSAAGTGTPLVWGVRQSLADWSTSSRSTRAVIVAGACASFAPDALLYNSRVAREQHEAAGYRTRRTCVVPNGFDLERFRPRPGAREALRRRLGAPDAFVVGWIARNHPVKDPETLLAAFDRIAGDEPRARLVVAGRGLGPEAPPFSTAFARSRHRERVAVLGEVDEVEELLSGLDVLAQTSLGEGFPNAVGEAMASGVPVVATDVGDTAELVGSAGTLVPPGDVEGIAAAVLALRGSHRRAAGERGRERIAAAFSAELAAERTASFHATVRDAAGAR